MPSHIDWQLALAFCHNAYYY